MDVSIASKMQNLESRRCPSRLEFLVATDLGDRQGGLRLLLGIAFRVSLSDICSRLRSDSRFLPAAVGDLPARVEPSHGSFRGRSEDEHGPEPRVRGLPLSSGWHLPSVWFDRRINLSLPPTHNILKAIVPPVVLISWLSPRRARRSERDLRPQHRVRR